nr:bifunctional 5,10-methylenetetrahydrofolate dehydrogenase/5,10-methenyltetrahydrofolate cyclohydrolase [Lyticum sinuosum]
MNSAIIMNGNEVAGNILVKIKEIIKKKGIIPNLAVILVGDNPASLIYVNNKMRKAKDIGIECHIVQLPYHTTQKELLLIIESYNKKVEIDGIIVQMPLPNHINSNFIIESISPDKDVDGFHPYNIGKLSVAESGFFNKYSDNILSLNKLFVPCTAAGIMTLLKHYIGDLSGKNTLIIGRSNIVGKPTSIILLTENATITIAHSYSKNIEELCLRADILICAIGKPLFVKGSWIKQGACVIDVGINRIHDNKIIGDVEYDNASKVASYITPVPGGVGPMTIAYLLYNTLQAHLYNYL